MISVCILIFFAAIAALYLFSVAPSAKKNNNKKRFVRDYAHRGLHGGNIDENTIEAFAAACDAGYGIELDVQLAADGEVVVLHDYDTSRMCGTKYSVAKTDSKTLTELKMPNSGSHMPLFKDALNIVSGRVPLLIELKGENLDTRLCDAVHKLLCEYGGDYCVESFNPVLLQKFKKLEPDTVCGILSCRMKDARSMNFIMRFALENMLLNFLCRPDFVAYKFDELNFSAKLCHRMGAVLFAWTPRGSQQCLAAKKRFDAVIFEEQDAL